MQWTLKEQPNEDEVIVLAKALNIDPILAKLLVQRGIRTYKEARSFFRPDLNELHDPFLMKDMDKAADRILYAIEKKEKILVYGDYDVDGTTAVSLMYTYLQNKGVSPGFYIPDRYTEGYGLSYKGIDYASENEYSLLVILDCGIKAVDKIKYANERGIDCIICDHHRPGLELPQAAAILNPKRTDCSYPYKELCGCGIGFKLIQAIAQRLQEPPSVTYPFLDLVATAIGADIVPITGENRIMAYHGLNVINTSPRPGIEALRSSLQKNCLTITDVVFVIAPRINAAGRMNHGRFAVELLICSDASEANRKSQQIEYHNTDRKYTDQSITEEALLQIENNKAEEQYSTIVYEPHWHKGVIGIVASRLIETYYRPTIVFTESGEYLAASARSVRGFDIYKAIEACAPFIEQFGGHKYAAGLTLKKEKFQSFKKAFENVVRQTLSPECRKPCLSIDSELSFESITPKFYRILKQFAPFGPGNMKPVFQTCNVKDSGFARTVGNDDKHLKCKIVELNTGYAIESIGFNMGYTIENMSKEKFDIAYTLNENTWNNKTSIQLQLKDLQF